MEHFGILVSYLDEADDMKINIPGFQNIFRENRTEIVVVLKLSTVGDWKTEVGKKAAIIITKTKGYFGKR